MFRTNTGNGKETRTRTNKKAPRPIELKFEETTPGTPIPGIYDMMMQASSGPTGAVLKSGKERLIEGDSQYRKQFPMCEGLLDYFPDALAAVSEVSFHGNNKHNPGEPLHHARGKSMDHANCILRHLTERGGFDGDIRHSAALAWRALALLQEELEQECGLKLPRGARAPADGPAITVAVNAKSCGECHLKPGEICDICERTEL